MESILEHYKCGSSTSEICHCSEGNHKGQIERMLKAKCGKDGYLAIGVRSSTYYRGCGIG